MSTRSGKRLHASVDNPNVVTDIIMQSERKTRSHQQKENVELNTKTKHNYVSYPTDEPTASFVSNNEKEKKTKKSRRNTLKEHNVNVSEYDNLESNNNKNVKKTCKGKKLIEPDNDGDIVNIQNHEKYVTNANDKKRNKKKKNKKSNYVQSPEILDITNHVKKKNKIKTQKSLKSTDITDLNAKQTTCRSDMSADSFHSAASSPIHIKLIKNGNEIEDNSFTSAFKPADAMITSNTTIGVIKETRNSTTRNSTFDKIEINDFEKSADVTNNFQTTIDLATKKQRNSHKKKSTVNIIEISDAIEKQNLDITYDKTAELLTTSNNISEESYKMRMRPSIVNSTIDNHETNHLSNHDRTFEKVADTPTTSNSKISTRKKIKSTAKNSTLDKIETSETEDVNNDNTKINFSNTFQSDNISNISIKNARNSIIKNSTFDKIEIKDLENSLEVITNSNTTVDLTERKKRKSNRKNSTYDKIEINDSIEKNNLDTTFDKTSDMITAFNTTDESIGNRMRSSIIYSTVDNLKINKLNNPDGTFEKILDIPTISKTTLSTSKKIKSAVKKSTLDKIEEKQPVVVNEDNIQTSLGDTFDSDNSANVSIKNTRNSIIRSSTFDKIEITDIEKSPDVTTSSSTTPELAAIKQKKSVNKNSTYDKIDINDTIENNDLDTTFDKTDNVLTAFNTMTDESIRKRMRSGIMNTARTDISETYNISNMDRTSAKVVDTPMTSNTGVSTRNKIKSAVKKPALDKMGKKQTRVVNVDSIKSTLTDKFTPRNPNKPNDHYNNIGYSNRKSGVINYNWDKVENDSENNEFIYRNITFEKDATDPQINSLSNENLTNNSSKKKSNRNDFKQTSSSTLECTSIAKSNKLDSTFDKDTSISHVNKLKVTTDSNKSAIINFDITESTATRTGGRKRSLTVSTVGDAERRSKRTRFCDELQHSVERLSRPRTQSSAAKLPDSGTPFKKFGTPTKIKPENKMTRTKLPNFAVLHQKQFSKMESLDECQERKTRRAKVLLTPTGCVGLLERISPKESPEVRTGGRKRSLTVSTVSDAETRSKRTRFCDELQHSVERLSRPRTQSSAAKLPDSGTPFKKFGTPTKIKPENKVARTKLPNFAVLHQKQFSKMESLDECQERKARRAKELLTPTGCVGLLERISPKGTPPKAAPPAKEPATKLHTPSKTKLYTLESLNPGYTRFGFKLNVDENPFCATRKPEVKSEKHERGPSKTTRSMLPSLAGTAGAAGRRRAAAKHAVMREKSFSEKRDTKRKESRTLIKGVRTNRRFELQMKMRNINA